MKPAALRLAALAILLSSCTTPPADPSQSEESFSDRERRLQAVATWEMRGRIAVDTGADAWQGRFTWSQDAEDLRVWIRGPLNSRPVEITGDGSELTVRTRRETRILENPETQLSELLGWWLPITSLPSWLLGLPDQRYGAAALVLDGALLSALQQRAWRLDFDEYARHDFARIPARIRLANEPLELVVTIDEWTPLSDSP